MQYFNNSIIKLASQGAVKIAIKKVDSAVIISENIIDDFFILDSTNWLVGVYYYQLFDKDGKIIYQGAIKVNENLLTASDDYDPRSDTEVTLEAIDACLEGRATSQQQSISIDGKSIAYSSFDELLKWREFFCRKVESEKGIEPVSSIKINVIR